MRRITGSCTSSRLGTYGSTTVSEGALFATQGASLLAEWSETNAKNIVINIDSGLAVPTGNENSVKTLSELVWRRVA